jgi:ribulose-5-phosphate 4-epimerase/fuculose-1-phosphate aldolase
MAAALPSLTALTTLDLNFNRIGTEGATALAAAIPLTSPKFLNMFFIGFNEMSEASKEALARVGWRNGGIDRAVAEAARAAGAARAAEAAERSAHLDLLMGGSRKTKRRKASKASKHRRTNRRN